MIDDESAEGFRPLEQLLRKEYFDTCRRHTTELKMEDFQLLTCYLRRMLVIDPEERASLNDLITDPWISGAS